MKMKTLLKRTILAFITFMALLCIAALCYMIFLLPNEAALKDVQLQVPMRIYTADHKLMAEYGEVRRIPIAYDHIPKQLINAVLDTEDKRFYHHSGIDVAGLARAALVVLTTGHKAEGGSTITMQVARNFFLTRQKTYSRKLHEILLAIKIDHVLSKQKILELYFNKVFLGKHAYGFASAAQTYYGKPLNELTLPQLAMLAGLPKAPSTINPLINPEKAKERRNHVLYRMLEMGNINKKTYQAAIEAPVTASYHYMDTQVDAPYVAEMVRAELYQQYGEHTYNDGFQIVTTINSHDQLAATQALEKNLKAYTLRHGYYGPEQQWGFFAPDQLDEWAEKLSDIPPLVGLQAAAALFIEEDSVKALLSDGRIINVPFESMTWAKPIRKDGSLGKSPTSVTDVVSIGDIIRVAEVNHQWQLRQVPRVEGALIAVDPNTGKVTALDGGLDFNRSHFNRVTQARRQAGSSFKPFIYTAALDKGITLATVINDAPIVIQDSGAKTTWRPQNDTHKFYGPTRVRDGLTYSRNLVSIRLLQQIGLPYALDYVQRFGFDRATLPNSLSLALGTANVTPMQMAEAYSIIANGGYRIEPYLIESITAGTHLIFTHQATPLCNDETVSSDTCRQRVISPQMDYLITSAMQSVIEKGTGRGALVLKRKDLAGKTGTTNDQADAWFAGFNHSLVAISWVGFDTPQSLEEYGSKAALPMWVDFMKTALKGMPESKLPRPSGIITARIDPATGKLVHSSSQHYLYEIFNTGQLPEYESQVESTSHLTTDNSTASEIGELY